MIFSRIIYCALLVGALMGTIMTLMQTFNVDPIIFAAETYEIADEAQPSAADSHSDGNSHSHSHDTDAWAPEDGIERSFYTLLANIFAGVGFAALLLALMSQFWLRKAKNISWFQGSLWGLAGFITIYLAPAIGLPPEIPGAEAAPLADRQLWWLLTITCVGLGIGIFAFANLKLKIIGAVFVLIPYLIGAPHLDGPVFTHPDPDAVIALTQLHSQFILASAMNNLIFWLLLGIACSLAFNRWFRDLDIANTNLCNDTAKA